MRMTLPRLVCSPFFVEASCAVLLLSFGIYCNVVFGAQETLVSWLENHRMVQLEGTL